MAATVEAHVHDQRVAIAFSAEVAVELGKARAHHVGQVEVAHASATGLVHPGAVALHPLAIAGRRFVGQRSQQHLAARQRAVGLRRGQRERHLGAGVLHQHGLRRRVWRHGLATHRHDALARHRLHTHGVEG